MSSSGTAESPSSSNSATWGEYEARAAIQKAVAIQDMVNHPAHYAEGWSNGAEVIDITENLNFNRGNAVKYLARAGTKDPARELEDLRKAAWYVQREIGRMAQ